MNVGEVDLKPTLAGIQITLIAIFVLVASIDYYFLFGFSLLLLLVGTIVTVGGLTR